MRLRTKILIPLITSAVFLFMISDVGVYLLWWISFALAEPIPSYDELSDSVIFDRTKDMPEVKAYLERYPNSLVFVDRVDHFAVHHQITRADLTGEPEDKDAPIEYIQPYLSLNVRLGGKGYPDSIVLWCTTDEHGQFKIEIASENELVSNLNAEICRVV